MTWEVLRSNPLTFRSFEILWTPCLCGLRLSFCWPFSTQHHAYASATFPHISASRTLGQRKRRKRKIVSYGAARDKEGETRRNLTFDQTLEKINKKMSWKASPAGDQ